MLPTIRHRTQRTYEAEQFLRRISGASKTQLRAYSTLIDRLVARGLWKKLDWLGVFATNLEANALINLTNSTVTFTLANTPPFTANQGYTGGSGGQARSINTNFNASTAVAANYQRNSGSIFVWNRTAGSGAALFGTSSTTATFITPNSAGTAFGLVNSGGSASGAVADAAGFYLATRTGANVEVLYKNGAVVGSGVAGSAALVNETMNVLRAGASYGGGQAALAGAGGGMTAEEQLRMYEAFLEYKTTIGF